jgi:hypothetical protein
MRNLALLTLTLGVVFGHSAGSAGLVYAADAADPTEPRLVRVRAESPEVAALLGRASATSATFRRLMAAIDGTDGLVYIDDGTCGHGVRACLVLHVQVAGSFRILHIRVDARQIDCGVMGSIGHELQHAIEILSDPHVTSGAAAYLFFDRIAGQRTGQDKGTFETAAADRAGVDVRDEACTVEGR